MKHFSTQQINECKHFFSCPGCEYLEDDFSKSNWEKILLFFKKSSSTKTLPKLFIEDVVHYRYKAKLAVRRNNGVINVGLFKKNSHEVVDIDGCYLHHPSINEAMHRIKKWMVEQTVIPYDEKTNTGEVRYIQIFVERRTKKVQLVLVLNHKYEKEIIKRFSEKLKKIFSQKDLWHSIWLNFQPKKTNTIFGDAWHLCFGESFLWQKILHTNIAFHPACFSQIHFLLFEQMLQNIYHEVPMGASLLELYAGVGAIGLNVLNKCKKIDFVEDNPFAKKAFDMTISKMKLESSIAYHSLPVKNALHLLDNANIIIIDPPRKGADKELLKKLFEQKNTKLIYVSCNFTSFEADCHKLIENGWKLKSLDGYLLFPKTSHIEILAVLER